jgi:hypothetical protein
MSSGQLAIFYCRDGCHLCEEMAASFYRCWPGRAEGLAWVNVDDDPQLVARFGTDIPILAVGQDSICRHTPDPDKVIRYFGPAAIPV